MRFVIFLLLLSSMMSQVVKADLLITPTRIVFDRNDRVQEVILVNTANEVRTYSLSWSELMQNETSGYNILTDGDKEQFRTASEFLRFSPRRLTLQPGENQRIKLSLRRTSAINEAEYRSHLKFTVIPNDLINGAQEEEEKDGVFVKLNLFLNYSIPVMVKNSNDVPNTSISNVVFQPKTQEHPITKIFFNLSKDKDVSVIGDTTVYFKAQGSDEFSPIGYNNNLAMYHERNQIRANVTWTEELNPGKGQLKIVYKGKKEFADKVLTEAIVNI